MAQILPRLAEAQAHAEDPAPRQPKKEPNKEEYQIVAGATWSRQRQLRVTGRFVWKPMNKAGTAWIAMPEEE